MLSKAAWPLALLLLAEASANPAMRGFLSPGSDFSAVPAQPEPELWLPWCSSSVSKRVRAELDAAVDVNRLPESCPFHPSKDVRNASNASQAQEPGRVCLADFCEIFGVCPRGDALSETPSAAEACDAAAMARQRKRCDQAVSKCFPPGAADKDTRQKYTQFSRQWCQVLDCSIRAHHQKEHENSLVSTSPVLALVAFACLSTFAAMVVLVAGGDEFLQLLCKSGVLSSSLARSCIQARDQLRTTAGLTRAKGT
eukprot:s573_g4.t1